MYRAEAEYHERPAYRAEPEYPEGLSTTQGPWVGSDRGGSPINPKEKK